MTFRFQQNNIYSSICMVTETDQQHYLISQLQCAVVYRRARTAQQQQQNK